ncbi:hypothetical protein D3C83_332680 [compost metagenome]
MRVSYRRGLFTFTSPSNTGLAAIASRPPNASAAISTVSLAFSGVVTLPIYVLSDNVIRV